MAVNGTGSLVVLVIVLLVALTFLAQVEGKPQENIIQDKEHNDSRIIDYSKPSQKPDYAKRGQFPWHVLIEVKKFGFWYNCAGSIIDQMWVMSAAHCFVKKVEDGGYIHTADRIKIYAGVVNSCNSAIKEDIESKFVQKFSFQDDDIMARRKDKKLFIHSEYSKSGGRENDIALIKLKEPVTLNAYVMPILLATDEDFKPDKTLLKISGFGNMVHSSKAEDAESPSWLRFVNDLNLKSRDDCKKKFRNYDANTMICQLTENKRAYKGDSGGAYVFEIKKEDSNINVQIGINSWGNIEEVPWGNVLVDVAKYRTWIHETMSYSPDDNPPGYFRSSGRWYRLFLNEKAKWDDANLKCNSVGMMLAEPKNDMAVQLRIDQEESFGKFDSWIGGKGNGNEFEFKVTKNTVDLSSSLLDVTDADILGASKLNCLSLHGSDMRTKPYDINSCFTKLYPLCQDFPDGHPGINTCNNCAGGRTFITRSGLERCVSTSCPDDEDFFTLTVEGKQQCFKVLDESATWEKANEACTSTGLELAHPLDSIQLRSYIAETYDPGFYAWLGACQFEPNKMTWKNSKTEITAEDPLWYPGQPDHSEGCLLLLSSKEYLEEEPDKPFWNVIPTNEFQPLCELILE